MKIQLLINVEAPDAEIISGLNSEMHQAITVLAIDCLQSGFNRSDLFKIHPEVATLPKTFSFSTSEPIVPLLTKSDLARRFDITIRTLERWLQNGKLPQPVRLDGAPRWRPEAVEQFERATGC